MMTDDIQKITGQCKNIIITQNCKKLKVTGQSNKVKIKSEIKELFVSGMDNHINGEEPNCLIHTIFLNGMDNFVKLNSRSANAEVEINGMENKVKIGDRIIRQSSSNNNNYSYNNRVHIQVFPVSYTRNNINNINVSNNSNDEAPSEEFKKKKNDLILEMDEFQYKHIIKYDSRKETSCSICLTDFERVDIIKVFHKCGHIFHKKCLLEWLKKSNLCPLCKYDLTNDINSL